MKMFLLLLLCGMVIPGFSAGNLSSNHDSLEARALDELEREGRTKFFSRELALIAADVKTTDQLAEQLDRLEALIEGLRLPQKQAGQPSKKKAKALARMVKDRLKQKDEQSYSLLDLLDDGTYSGLTAAWLYFEAALGQNIEYADLAEEGLGWEPQLFMDGEPQASAFTAALFVKKAAALPDNRAEDVARALNLSRLLAPSSSYGKDGVDITFYNRAYKLFESKAMREGAQIAAAAAGRYPARPEFQALCYNFGIVLFKETETTPSFASAVSLGEALAPHTGEHQAVFKQAMDAVRYNYAVHLQNDGQFAASLEQAERIAQAPDAQGHHHLLVRAYETLAEERFLADDLAAVSDLVARLDRVDPARAAHFQTRLKQLKLKELHESGKADQALAEAGTQIGAELGVKNYIAVLTRSVQGQCEAGAFESAITTLDQVPGAVAAEKTVGDLRAFTYSKWLSSMAPDAVSDQVGLYRRLFADRKLKLTSQEADVYRENYGNLLYKEIESLIENRRFHEADKQSREALTELRDHGLLRTQRDLLDQIMKRIKE